MPPDWSAEKATAEASARHPAGDLLHRAISSDLNDAENRGIVVAFCRCTAWDGRRSNLPRHYVADAHIRSIRTRSHQAITGLTLVLPNLVGRNKQDDCKVWKEISVRGDSEQGSVHKSAAEMPELKYSPSNLETAVHR